MSLEESKLLIGLPGKLQLVNLANLKHDDVNAKEICRTLENINRFCGRGLDVVSVARHSVFVALLLECTGFRYDTVLGGICHDFSEAFIGDIIAPIKDCFPEISKLEKSIMQQVSAYIPIGDWQNEAVKVMDLQALRWEASICGFNTNAWKIPPKTVSDRMMKMAWTESAELDLYDYWMELTTRFEPEGKQ